MLVESVTAGKGQGGEYNRQGCKCVDTCGRRQVGEGLFRVYEGYLLGSGHLSVKRRTLMHCASSGK